tara:strand:+ start:613 stop:1200 length:588 start_codon:yes stop_codon:yes gene_type:complete
MGIVKSAGDLLYTFRFIRMMVMKWENWDAYKQGVIDEKGKRIKGVKLNTDAKKDSYTPFVRLCANVKRLISKIPGGGTKLGSFAAALYLIKEDGNLSDKSLQKILKECDLESLDFLAEDSQWFVLEDQKLSPGIYQINNHKIVNSTFEELVYPKDKIKIYEDCYPKDSIFGLNIYEGIHLKTNQRIYITNGELYK